MSFHDWWTNENNPSLPKSEYLFGTRHIIMICAAVLAVIVLSIIFFNKTQRAKNILLSILVSILLFFEITSRVVNLAICKEFSWQNILKILLPMHICSVAVVTLIISFFLKKKMLLTFSTILGIIATFAFLAYPAVGINKTYISFTCLYSITSHVTGFVVACLLINLGYVKFEFKDIWKTYLCFAIMFGYGALLDFVILPGSDYMYLRNDPLELGLNFPYHILYGALLMLYIFMFYFITFIVDKIKRKRASKKTQKSIRSQPWNLFRCGSAKYNSFELTFRRVVFCF